MPRTQGLLLLLFVCMTHGLLAQQKFTLYAGAGYQAANSRWSIAGNSNGTNPNIYSELIWKNLQGINTQAGIRYRFCKQWGLRADYSQVFTHAGDVTDTDYGADNRRQPVYEGSFRDNKGGQLTLDAALTYTFHLPKVLLTPMLGYVYNKQELYVLPKDAGTPATLHSTYFAHWKGLLAGAEASFALGSRFALLPALQYYQLRYDATANWNLITQFQHPRSFTHAANGFSLKPSLQLQYNVNTYTKIFLQGHYAYWNTGAGTDELYLVGGQVDHTQLNGVKRTEGGALLGVSFSW